MWINKDKNKDGIRLDIGAGDTSTLELQETGYVLNDIEPHKGIDLVCDILDLKKYLKEGQCAEVRASHILEHFGKHDLVRVLRIVHFILKDKGIFNIVVPNLKWQAQFLFSGEDEKAVYYIFGGQLDKYDFHKTGFTADILKKLLLDNGFTILELLERTSIECKAMKI